ncbi:MAG: prepilin-type N-terminal cleavage/methylation domain-containing protein [FCB group bacterium]|nr:prepilin-type N-terminal cleavage/methylation domain-containing protein [FCB group bacterium]
MRTARGFTLIEMLVTLTLYGVVMSVLLAGLQTGIRGWRTLARHQAQSAEQMRAFERMRRDFRHLCPVTTALPALAEAESAGALDTVELCVLDTRLKQRAGLGAVWYRVSYSVRSPHEKMAPALYRRAAPCVAGVPDESRAVDELLVNDVRRFSVRYNTPAGFREEWNARNSLPFGVVVDLSVAGRPPAQMATLLPCGMTDASP